MSDSTSGPMIWALDSSCSAHYQKRQNQQDNSTLCSINQLTTTFYAHLEKHNKNDIAFNPDHNLPNPFNFEITEGTIASTEILDLPISCSLDVVGGLKQDEVLLELGTHEFQPCSHRSIIEFLKLPSKKMSDYSLRLTYCEVDLRLPNVLNGRNPGNSISLPVLPFPSTISFQGQVYEGVHSSLGDISYMKKQISFDFNSAFQTIETVLKPAEVMSPRQGHGGGSGFSFPKVKEHEEDKPTFSIEPPKFDESPDQKAFQNHSRVELKLDHIRAQLEREMRQYDFILACLCCLGIMSFGIYLYTLIVVIRPNADQSDRTYRRRRPQKESTKQMLAKMLLKLRKMFSNICIFQVHTYMFNTIKNWRVAKILQRYDKECREISLSIRTKMKKYGNFIWHFIYDELKKIDSIIPSIFKINLGVILFKSTKFFECYFLSLKNISFKVSIPHSLIHQKIISSTKKSPAWIAKAVKNILTILMRTYRIYVTKCLDAYTLIENTTRISNLTSKLLQNKHKKWKPYLKKNMTGSQSKSCLFNFKQNQILGSIFGKCKDKVVSNDIITSVFRMEYPNNLLDFSTPNGQFPISFESQKYSKDELLHREWGIELGTHKSSKLATHDKSKERRPPPQCMQSCHSPTQPEKAPVNHHQSALPSDGGDNNFARFMVDSAVNVSMITHEKLSAARAEKRVSNNENEMVVSYMHENGDASLSLSDIDNTVSPTSKFKDEWFQKRATRKISMTGKISKKIIIPNLSSSSSSIETRNHDAQESSLDAPTQSNDFKPICEPNDIDSNQSISIYENNLFMSGLESEAESSFDSIKLKPQEHTKSVQMNALNDTSQSSMREYSTQNFDNLLTPSKEQSNLGTSSKDPHTRIEITSTFRKGEEKTHEPKKLKDNKLFSELMSKAESNSKNHLNNPQQLNRPVRKNVVKQISNSNDSKYDVQAKLLPVKSSNVHKSRSLSPGDTCAKTNGILSPSSDNADKSEFPSIEEKNAKISKTMPKTESPFDQTQSNHQQINDSSHKKYDIIQTTRNTKNVMKKYPFVSDLAKKVDSTDKFYQHTLQKNIKGKLQPKSLSPSSSIASSTEQSNHDALHVHSLIKNKNSAVVPIPPEQKSSSPPNTQPGTKVSKLLSKTKLCSNNDINSKTQDHNKAMNQNDFKPISSFCDHVSSTNKTVSSHLNGTPNIGSESTNKNTKSSIIDGAKEKLVSKLTAKFESNSVVPKDNGGRIYHHKSYKSKTPKRDTDKKNSKETQCNDQGKKKESKLDSIKKKVPNQKLTLQEQLAEATSKRLARLNLMDD